MARSSRQWETPTSVDLREPAVARAFLLAAGDEGVSLQVALAKVVRALGVKEFARHVHMAPGTLERALRRQYVPPVATSNRLLAPFGLHLAVRPKAEPDTTTRDLTESLIAKVALRVAAREAAARQKRSVVYSFHGTSPKVGRLLDATLPKSPHERWHKGDVRPSGRSTKTWGVRVELGDFDDTKALVRSVYAFLRRDSAFLRSASACRGPRAWSDLSVLQFVYPFVPTSVSLPSRTLATLGELGVELDCTGYPCED